MKILTKNYARLKDRDGRVKLMPEESEDLWIIYNLVCKGDTVKSFTTRKVPVETDARAREGERVKIILKIRVEIVEYDKEGSVLRVRGKNISQNQYVEIGQFHTLEIEPRRFFVLGKAVWDSMAIDSLRQAANPAASADIAVVLITEGLANIFLVGNSITTQCCRREASIPRKHGPAIACYESALNKFFGTVLQAFLKYVDFKVVRCAVIAGPGLASQQFTKHLLLGAERKNLRDIFKKQHSLGDVLDAPHVMKLIKDTKAAKEVQVLNKFFEMLSNDQDRAWYGPKHIEVAHERMAIQVLLITDELFRNTDIATRKKYVELVKSVEDTGGNALIFSSMHVSGERLAQLTGIAAILRFPLPNLEDMEI
ncbi:CDP-diacylglycerol--glycerol-3-phosphate 3-phosphatidyltransferase [Ranunculus cassubicifolius]